MSKVRIVQCLCPQRHCVIGCAYESPDGAEIPEYAELLRQKFEDKSGFLKPECGLCHSTTLVFEDRPTGFATMDEAAPHFYAAEREQIQTRRFFESGKN